LKIDGKAKSVAIFIGESDKWHGQSLDDAIVARAHAEGIAGATVFHGVEGFGANSVIHRASFFKLSHDRPVVIMMVDHADRIDPFLIILDEMVQEGMVVTWEVNVEKYVHGEDR